MANPEDCQPKEVDDFVLDLIRSFDIEQSSDGGYKLLQEATKQGHTTAIRLLIEKGAAVNSDKYFASYTPLHWAVRNGDSKIVELLLDKGAKMSDETWDGLSPFYLAVSGGEEITHLYLTDDQRNEQVDGETSPQTDLTGIVTLLLNRGSDVNQKCWEGQTPLHVACNSRSLLRNKTIVILLERGADVNCCDNFGNTPLHVVVVSDIPDPCSAALLLLRHGADVNARTGTEETPLHVACRSRSSDRAKLFKMLVNEGADINAKSLRGYTPLHMSLCRNQVELSLLLLSKGADLNSLNNENATPLHCIVRNNQKPILRHIAKHNVADISENLRILSERGFTYFTSCKQQIERMKNTTIDSSTVTYFHILMADDHRLSCLASNTTLSEAIERSPALFPDFSTELQGRWMVGVARCNSLSRLKTIRFRADSVSLTYDALLKIAYYLSTEEVENIITAFSLMD